MQPIIISVIGRAARAKSDNGFTNAVFRPKSKRLIARELRDKRVDAEIIEQVTKDIDDEEIAHKLGSSRLACLAHLDYPNFYRRLASYLAYRGFSYEVIKRTASLLWQEKEQG